MCSLYLGTLKSHECKYISYVCKIHYCGYCHHYYFTINAGNMLPMFTTITAFQLWHTVHLPECCYQMYETELYQSGVTSNGILITQNFIKICPTVLELKHVDEQQTGLSLHAFFSCMCKEHTITETNIPSIYSFHAGFHWLI